MAGLLDYLQAASNAVAGNVSGPVDLINSGLLAAGLPMPRNPVGGSQWMAERGLTREVKDPYARVIGETAGLLAPTVIAAKAPQIADGLLSHADAYRRYHAAATAPGAPATVWHGSPHKFDKFDAAHIGKGEGAQAYGHGLYFAENPAVARTYADKVSAVTVDGKTFATSDPGVARVMRMVARDPEDARKFFQTTIAGSNDAEQIAQWKAAFQLAEKSKLGLLKTPSLYKVDLPDEAIARMLDWDKPLSQQPEAVRKAVDAAIQAGRLDRDSVKAIRDFDPSGSALYRLLAIDAPGATGTAYRGSAQSADSFRRAGVPGIRYLDGGSRGAGTGTSNYVVFPGEEGLLKILSRE